mmetsp:Transcript_54550/g.115890  ORF Transcript_54550/g.115890 Transcript_54550/m.115890 type:complete len:115 (-) Transcript_54550:269-613(-)
MAMMSFAAWKDAETSAALMPALSDTAGETSMATEVTAQQESEASITSMRSASSETIGEMSAETTMGATKAGSETSTGTTMGRNSSGRCRLHWSQVHFTARAWLTVMSRSSASNF